jgi:hypothetical protein
MEPDGSPACRSCGEPMTFATRISMPVKLSIVVTAARAGVDTRSTARSARPATATTAEEGRRIVRFMTQALERTLTSRVGCLWLVECAVVDKHQARSERYRSLATDCIGLAENTDDPTKMVFASMALGWLKLADLTELWAAKYGT